MNKTAAEKKQELKTLAESLPFKSVELPEFKKKSFAPERIRQERRFVRMESGAQAISRFLMERGVVEILKNKQVTALFTEIHWCAFTVRKLARKRFTSDDELNETLNRARLLISETEAAEEELFIANRRLVVSCVKPFYWIGQVWISDFLQEGSKALTNAVRKFDFTRGTPFYAYAQKAIQNRLRNFFRDHVRSGSIGIRPTREMQLLRRVLEEWQEQHPDKKPEHVALAQIAGLTEQQVAKVLPFVKQWTNTPAPPVSLDAELGETESTLYDLVEDTHSEAAAHAAQKSEIWAAVDRLPPRAGYIMRLRFIEGLTLEETGQKLSLTRARIKQIQDESMKKLRQMLHRGPYDNLG